MAKIKCPRCNEVNHTKNHSCEHCGLPLKANKLLQYGANIEMQWDRINDETSDILYEDSHMRVYPSSKTDELNYTKRIVYYQNHQFVLLDFVNIIHRKKAIIHFKIRSEKSVILFYKRNHRLSDIFMNILESIAESLDLDLKDITKIFEHHIQLDQSTDKFPRIPNINKT